MDIQKQIYNLSSNPIFFISPNIDIKMELIKRNYNLLNNRFKGFYNEIILNKGCIEIDNINIDEDFFAFMMMFYLNNRSSTCDCFRHLQSKKDQLEGKVAFYANAFLAFYHFDNNNYEIVEPHIKFLLDYIENQYVDSYEKMCIYSLTANFLQKTKDIFISGAEKYFLEALKIAKEKDYFAYISLLNTVAYYYHNIEKLDKAIDYINEAVKQVEKIDFPSLSFNTYKNAGIIFVTLGEFEKAKIYFKKAKDSSKYINENIEYIKLLNTLGYVEFLQGNFYEALNIFEQAIEGVIKIPKVSNLLDEAVKTFDNISNVLKYVGDISNSIYFQKLAIDILKNINYNNLVNEVHNLSKGYTDLGLTYLVYSLDIENAYEMSELAKIQTDENEHYIKRNKKIILEGFIKYLTGHKVKGIELLNQGFDNLILKGEENLYVQLVLIELMIFYSKITKNNEFVIKAKSIATKYNLEKHYNSLKNIILNENDINYSFNISKYPLNLIKLLSIERKDVLIESKKSKDYALIDEFTTNIANVQQEYQLVITAESILNKHFLSKGLIILNSNENDSNFVLKYCNKDCETIFYSSIIPALEKMKIEDDIVNFHGHNRLKSFMVTKIVDSEDKEIYYIILYNDYKSDWYFNKEQLKTFKILANNLYFKYKNLKQVEKIRLNAITDFMTGLKNATYYNKRVKELIEIFNKTGKSFAMVIIDLNKFKQINDTYGHEAGDRALKHFAKLIGLLKDKAEIIRYGGDEFILIFEEVNKNKIIEYLEEIKCLTKKQPLLIDETEIIIDFSYGVDVYNGQSEADFFRKVDMKMYKDKKERK